ncbi:hypothetical protein ACLKA7_001785 [Drosophila subpalustris]
MEERNSCFCKEQGKQSATVQAEKGEKAEVRSLTETATMEIHDLDEVTTEEVLESLLSQFGEIKINRTSSYR